LEQTLVELGLLPYREFHSPEDLKAALGDVEQILIDVTSSQLNIPLNNVSTESVNEIEVTDPRHPLFARRFTVLHIPTTSPNASYVLVTYREYMALRIPLGATNLLASQPQSQTKLTRQALTELIALAQECEVLCLTSPQKSGADCRQNTDNKSATHCH
jgi:hypothetical protein